MDLRPFVDKLRRELAAAPDASHEPAIRLMLLDALSAAADEITRELAPGSVELRLRGGEPSFAVAPPPTDEPEAAPAAPAAPSEAAEDGATARINLRLPEQLKAAVEQAASRERLSVNSWLVRVAAAAVAGDATGPAPRKRGGRIGQSYTGWVR